MIYVNRLTTCYLTVTPKDATGNPAVPTALTYHINDKNTGTVILAPTAVTPGAPVTITITAAQNEMINLALAQEVHAVTVQATYGAGDTVYAEYDYTVQNLHYVP